MQDSNLKPDSNFRLSKTVKRMLTRIVDTDLRNAFRRNMIQAQLAAEQADKSSKSDKQSKK